MLMHMRLCGGLLGWQRRSWWQHAGGWLGHTGSLRLLLDSRCGQGRKGAGKLLWLGSSSLPEQPSDEQNQNYG